MDKLNDLLIRDDPPAAAELARVLADALDDIRAGHGDDRPY
jgi:hypothetical protein